MLDGIRVVEFGTYVAVPTACALLADYGADVIKVENPKGDPFRQFLAAVGRDDPQNRVFEADNRGKRSIAIDLNAPEGPAELKALILTADVFVTNVRPYVLEKAGIDWESLKAIKPSLIYVEFTGFGACGPEKEKPGFDIAAFWARSGLCSLTTPKGQSPAPLRTGIGDHVSGLSILSGVLGALYHRQRTGEGQKVETSLLRNGLFVASSEHAIQFQLGKLASTRPRTEANDPVNNFFCTGDGRWLVTVPRTDGSDWVRLTRALGLSDLVEDERFNSIRKRRENAAALVTAFDAAFARLSFDEAAAALDAEDMIWAPVLSVAQAANDPQAIAAGCFTYLDGEGGDPRSIVNGPIDFECRATVRGARAPGLNEHGAQIRQELAGSAS